MRKKNNIKVIFFDMGGVTIKWSDSIVYQHVAKITGMKKIMIKKLANREMKFFDRGLINERQFWIRVATDAHYHKILRGSWLENYGSHAKKDRRVFNTIWQLRKRGYRTATITNVIRPHYLYNKRSGIYAPFHRVFASCQLKMRKPGLEIYRYAIRSMRVKPNECLFIDNMKENVVAARKAGIQSFVFRNAGQMKKELRKYGIRA